MNKKVKQWDITTYILEWPKSRMLITQILERMWSNRNSHSSLVGMQKWYSSFSRAFGSFLQYYIYSHPSYRNGTWCILKGAEYLYAHKNCTRVFIAVLFTTAKIWKQPKCLLVSQCISRQWYIQTMEYYPMLQNELSSHNKIWKELKWILLRSQC